MKLLVVCILAAAAVANAEDDYTLKDWCKPFRPKSCNRMIVNADDGFRTAAREEQAECIKDTDKATEKNPECAGHLRDRRDRFLAELGRAERHWEEQDRMWIEIGCDLRVIKERRKAVNEYKANK